MSRGLKVFGAFVALCFTVVLGTGLAASPAKADTFDPNATYTFANANYGQIFDVEFESTSNGANIHTSSYYGRWSQQWRIQPTGDGYYKIVNANSGKVVDVYGPSMSNGANIHQWDYQGADDQKWSIDLVGSSYKIVNKYSGKVLDVAQHNLSDEFAKVHQWDYIPGTTSQLWKIKKINAPLPGVDPSKYYKIRLGTSNKAMDVALSSKSVMKIQTYNDNNGDNQKWKIVPFGDNKFTIMNKNSQMNMGYGKACGGTECVVQQYDIKDGWNLTWTIEDFYYPYPTVLYRFKA